MLSISFPGSAAWNEAIRPAIDVTANDSNNVWEAALESVAAQLAVTGASPDSVRLRDDDADEQSKLIGVGAKFVLEAILQAAAPGVPADAVSAALSKAATFGMGEPLGAAAAATAAAVWVRHAKKIATAQRARTIEEVCHRAAAAAAPASAAAATANDDDVNCLRYLSAEVRICSRSVGENDDAVAETDSHFEPYANFAIAPESIDVVPVTKSKNAATASATSAGTVLSLDPHQTYELLCEVDAIQRKLDALRGSA